MPNFFITYLAQSLATNGSETEFFFTTIKTLTGETITTSLFATFGRGIITIDPLNSTNIENASFTGVSAANISVTGGIRGLSALSNSVVTANKKYHPVGTPVIIAFGTHNVADILANIASTVAGSIGTASDTVAGSTKITENLATLPRAMSALIAQQTVPDMTLKVNPFSIVTPLGDNIKYAGGNIAAIVAPVTNPRIDLIVYSTSGSAIAVRGGSEGASPSEPTPTSGDIILCSVFLRVGSTAIYERNDSVSTHGYVKTWYQPNLYRNDLVTTTSYPVYAADVDQSQTTQDTSTQVGEANVTSKKNKLAQSFIPTHALIRGAKLYKSADTGTFTGTMTISLQANSSGSPSGSSLASQTITNAEWLLIPTGEFELAFTAEYAMTVGSLYWIVISASTSDTSNHPNIGVNSAGGYANGSCKYNNTTDGWLANGVIDLYFKTLEGIVGQIPTTDATSGILPAAVLPYSLVELNTTNSSVVSSSVTETTVYTKLLPAGFFKATTGLRIRGITNLSTEGSNDGISNTTINIKINGTVAITFNSPAPNLANNIVAYQMTYEGIILNTTLSTQVGMIFTNIGSGDYNITYSGQSAVSIGRDSGGVYGEPTASIDTSGMCILTITMQNRKNSGNTSFQHLGVIVEKIG